MVKFLACALSLSSALASPISSDDLTVHAASKATGNQNLVIIFANPYCDYAEPAQFNDGAFSQVFINVPYSTGKATKSTCQSLNTRQLLGSSSGILYQFPTTSGCTLHLYSDAACQTVVSSSSVNGGCASIPPSQNDPTFGALSYAVVC